MPRYFVDTDDGTTSVVDREGFEFADPGAARNAAIRALRDMAADSLPDGTSRTFRVAVRANARTLLSSATLIFEGPWEKGLPGAGN